MDQFLAGKKIAMLSSPAKYLQERNTKLAALPAAIKKDYDAALLEIQQLETGYANDLWVKQLAEDALLKAKARKRQVDIEFPILGSAYKAQKSKNFRELEAKKDFIK